MPVLAGRALSVVRVLRGQAPFMQKNLPAYPLCRSRRSMLRRRSGNGWSTIPSATMVVDLDPPAGADAFARAAQGALLVQAVLTDVGLTALAKTSGAKGVHVVFPLVPGQSAMDLAAATRAIAARAEQLDPKMTTTAFVVEERGGKVFLDATRAGGATVAADPDR